MNVGSLLLKAVVGLFVLTAPAWAWHVEGCVYCDANGNGVIDSGDIALPNVGVTVTAADGTVRVGKTDANGCYWIDLSEDDATYVVTLDPNTVPVGSDVLLPAGGSETFSLDSDSDWALVNWLLDCDGGEPEVHCWLTGGGVKFEQITNGTVAEHGPDNSMGGNIAPSCSLEPGDGGNWNHIAHGARLHFQGKVITKVRCGNVDGIPPGSTSPETGVNFLEAWGTGTLKGIKGNKVDFVVYFFLRCEDRNEPGSHGAKDGALVDRYFLNVYTDPLDPVTSSKLLIDIDQNAATVDPITITGGNLQIHASSCDDPPPDAFFAVQSGKGNKGKKK